jgi:sec-independent protein translocase protein TatC
MFLLNKLFNLRLPQTDVVKPFLDHMEDLRVMLIKMMVTLVLCMALSLGFRQDLTRLITRPLAGIEKIKTGQVSHGATVHPSPSGAGLPTATPPSAALIELATYCPETKRLLAERGQLPTTLPKPVKLDPATASPALKEAANFCPHIRAAFVNAPSPTEPSASSSEPQSAADELKAQLNILQVTGVADSILISLTLAFYAGIVFAFPILIYFLLEFLLPALTAGERKYLFPAVFGGFALFLIGVCFCYYSILPSTVEWLFQDAVGMGFDWRPRAREYFAFVTQLCIGFGLLCELPIATLSLALIGVISHKWMTETRPYAITVIMILAAIIAPTPDPVTFVSLATPIVILYEICIWLVWLVERRRKSREEAKAREFNE